MSSNVGKKCFKLWCVLCAVKFVTELLFTNIAGHLTTYFYRVSTQNCNFSKAQQRLPDDGPDGPKHVGGIMRFFNCIF
jgi:hypothetical protein